MLQSSFSAWQRRPLNNSAPLYDLRHPALLRLKLSFPQANHRVRTTNTEGAREAVVRTQKLIRGLKMVLRKDGLLGTITADRQGGKTRMVDAAAPPRLSPANLWPSPGLHSAPAHERVLPPAR